MSNRASRFLRFAAVALLLASGAATAAPAAKPDLRVLFLGNSYTYGNDLPQLVVRLGEAGRPRVRIEAGMCAPGGWTLEQHAAGEDSQKALRSGRWDCVVLQEQSMRPAVDPEGMFKGARALHAQVAAAGARAVFFMTWARRENPDMIEALAKSYEGIAKELGARVAPAGRAWDAARRQMPDVALHARDGSHATPAGSYLAACVIFRTLSGQPSSGRFIDGLPGLDRALQKKLQDIADQCKIPAAAAPGAPAVPEARATGARHAPP